jgi:hypothetical protein
MKRLLLVTLVLSCFAGAIALSRGPKAPATNGADLQVAVESRNPWTHLRLNNDTDTFRFAIVSDRTGGHRQGVFSRAVELLNLMQPEFVMSVGDLIEGSNDADSIARQWKEFQGFVGRLNMPFFYAPGNHDAITPALRDGWKERFGRPYYHFVYKNVLFLVLNDYDGEPVENAEGRKNYRLGFGAEQLAYVKKTLADNAAVRWTLVFLHAPVWGNNPGAAPKNGWDEVEQVLSDRSYTVFCGHIHRYCKYVRRGMNYYQLATTGGGSRLRGTEAGEFDHIAWVTMTRDGPVLANLLLDGILRDDLSRPATEEPGYVPGFGQGDGSVVPVRGRVRWDGGPVGQLVVRFTLDDPKDPKKRGSAEGLVEPDGSFQLTSSRPNDGAKPGVYVVSFAPRELLVRDGKRPANAVPAKYQDGKRSPLRAEVKAGRVNEFTFELED